MKKILITYAVKEEFVCLDSNDHYHIEYLRTGVGKTPSAHLLTKKIMEESPDFVLNIGTAGTLRHKVGDIFIATSFIDRDYEEIKLPGIEFVINGAELPDNPELENWVSTYPNRGVCSTGDTFVTQVSSLSGDFVDMEAYAQAYVCRELNTPFLSVKYITDVIGQNSVEKWENKLSDARAGLLQWFDKYKLLSLIGD